MIGTPAEVDAAQSDRRSNKDPFKLHLQILGQVETNKYFLACPFPFIPSFSVTLIITKNCIKNDYNLKSPEKQRKNWASTKKPRGLKPKKSLLIHLLHPPAE